MIHPAESLHWYSRDGQPAYEVEAAKGGRRPTTLRDARKLALVPSVTSIIKCAAAPGLERWKQEQVLMAALTLPRLSDESLDSFADRAMRDAQEQSKKAAERGKDIHAAIESRNTFGEYGEHVIAAQKLIYDWMPGEIWKQEQSFSHPLGFGGKVDDHAKGAVTDYKTTEKPLEELSTYESHWMQLAAYREGLEQPQAKCAIVYVSASKPEARLIEVPEEKLIQGWAMFKALLDYWYAKTGLKR